ncbi:hypothetical protein L1887_39975 [Cichorium endivia]|nr:hypothetical protein L1887_39975 [Cichorium endivia]
MCKVIGVTALCITIVLLLSQSPSAVARPPPNFTQLLKDDVEENCRGDGEEECLMRRTLVAHLDYIYTQSKQP